MRKPDTLTCAACRALVRRHRQPLQLLFPGVALLGEVFDGRGPAQRLLRVAAGEEREGLVGRASHVAGRREPGKLLVRGG